MESINIILSGLDPRTKLYRVNVHLVELFKNKPELFHPGIKLVGVQGSIASMKWASREPYSNFERISIPQIHDLVAWLRGHELSAYLDCSNVCLKERSFLDYHDNCIVELLNYPENYVLVDSDMLSKYIRSTYTNYTHLHSSHKWYTAAPVIDNLNKGNLTILPPKIPIDVFKKSDLGCSIAIINPWCECWCSRQREHITADSRAHFDYHNHLELRVDPKNIPHPYYPEKQCPNSGSSIYSKLDDPALLTYERMLALAQLGISKFMFSDYTFDSVTNLIETYLLTLVPEHNHVFVRTLITQAIEKEGLPNVFR